MLPQVAPLCTNAFVHMVMGRMVWNFTPAAKVFRVSAWRFGQLFVVLDIVRASVRAIAVQLCWLDKEHLSSRCTVLPLHRLIPRSRTKTFYEVRSATSDYREVH